MVNSVSVIIKLIIDYSYKFSNCNPVLRYHYEFFYGSKIWAEFKNGCILMHCGAQW